MNGGTVKLEVKSVGEKWSTVQDAEIKLDSGEVELDSKQWKQVSGTFQLPAHPERKEVAVRFVASENLVFCIDDLRIAAVDDDNTGDDREISENILSEYNTSFEGLDDKGKLYWWNGPSWTPDGINQKAYENSEKPS